MDSCRGRMAKIADSLYHAISPNLLCSLRFVFPSYYNPGPPFNYKGSEKYFKVCMLRF